MKLSSSEIPLWRGECEQQRSPRLYHFNSQRGARPGRQDARSGSSHRSPHPRLDSDGKLAGLIARKAPPSTIMEELIVALCVETDAACGVSFVEEGRPRLVAGPDRLTRFWLAFAETATTTKFRRARRRGDFENPRPTSFLGREADAPELQLLAEAIGFHGYQAIPLGAEAAAPAVLELFYSDPKGPSIQQVAEVQTAARIAQLAFACRL